MIQIILLGSQHWNWRPLNLLEAFWVFTCFMLEYSCPLWRMQHSECSRRNPEYQIPSKLPQPWLRMLIPASVFIYIFQVVGFITIFLLPLTHCCQKLLKLLSPPESDWGYNLRKQRERQSPWSSHSATWRLKLLFSLLVFKILQQDSCMRLLSTFISLQTIFSSLYFSQRNSIYET